MMVSTKLYSLQIERIQYEINIELLLMNMKLVIKILLAVVHRYTNKYLHR